MSFNADLTPLANNIIHRLNTFGGYEGLEVVDTTNSHAVLSICSVDLCVDVFHNIIVTEDYSTQPTWWVDIDAHKPEVNRFQIGLWVMPLVFEYYESLHSR